MIEPTVGRVVHYFANQHAPAMAAIVCHVYTPRLVNLAVFNAHGASFQQSQVTLLQDDDPTPEGIPYCAWMPYQKGQAAKTEALEAQVETRARQIKDPPHVPNHHPVG